jgi:GH24 family phage-related lysozyme (muramidase)
MFIAGFEGWRSYPYNDRAGPETIGFGYLLHRGPVTEHDLDEWATSPGAERSGCFGRMHPKRKRR